MRAGDLAQAERFALRALERAPDAAYACFIAGVSALELGRPVDALLRLERATALDGTRPAYWAQQARALAMLRRDAEALACCERAAALPGATAVTHDTLGNILTRCGCLLEAAREFGLAARAAPGDAQIQYNHASALMFCGDLAGAAAAYERVLAIDPDQARAHLALSDLLDGPPPPGRIEQLEAALARAAGDVDRMLIVSQALARSLEAAGDTQRAFALWEQSKAARKTAVGYTIDEDRVIFSAFERMFTAEAIADPRPGAPSRAPIFIVGLPRSGTTLVDRMLGSHSAIESAGELLDFPLVVKEAGGSRTPDLIDPAGLERALAADPAEIGARYLERVRIASGSSPRFIDKQPLNFLFIGFILRALPEARVICLRRGALDLCLANFRQLFALGFRYYRYALSLADTAEYLSLFQKLMSHWEQLLPGRFLAVQYETLVAEPESEIRRLVDYLGLEFEPGMLSFHENDTPVATASAAQVRRPIYQASVGSWRRYADELEPLRLRLEALGIAPEAEARSA